MYHRWDHTLQRWRLTITSFARSECIGRSRRDRFLESLAWTMTTLISRHNTRQVSLQILLKSCQLPYRIPIGSCRNPDREFNTTSVRPIREHYSRGEWHACLVLGLSKTKHSDRGYTFRKRDVRSERQERDTGINPETRQEEVRPESVKLNLICKLNSKVQDLFLLILRGLVANPK